MDESTRTTPSGLTTPADDCDCPACQALDLQPEVERLRAELAELRTTMAGDHRERIEQIQAERDAMPKEERDRREALDAPLLRIQLAHAAGETRRLKAELAEAKAKLPTCNGMCLTAADVGVPVAGNPVARAHRSCPEHGDLETVAWELNAALRAEGEKVDALSGDLAEARAAIKRAWALCRDPRPISVTALLLALQIARPDTPSASGGES